ncbi:centriolar and ciliogenesis-associated protein HYSL1-like [Physella acuta]|uniref:centriolar and ciliogenesis-associated protein HYSL1-like n=1 Tax=Physella acuta TaxID=109671 RepID=UPI0027DC62E7|nr:centriolar and ciliogenesis-associated protein HYSL1-like [Physella acuta]
MEFTDSEIREELARLGYRDVPDEKLAEFKKDLLKLIHVERSKTNSLNSSSDESKFESQFPKSSYEPRVNFTDNQTIHYPGTSYRDRKEYTSYGGDKSAPSSRSDYYSSSKSSVPGAYSLYEMPSYGMGSSSYHPQVNVNNSVPDEEKEYEADTETKSVKRKTSRKAPNGDRVVDESFNGSDVAGIYEIYEKIKNLAMRDCECGKTRSMSAMTEPPYRINGVNKNPSVIKMGQPPHTRNLKRTVPFKRHQMYQRLWKAQPAIGEDVRHHVRKDVHNKMLKREDIKVFHKVYVPNSYVVPTEKPRFNLRWNVRKANAVYAMPPHGFYHEI